MKVGVVGAGFVGSTAAYALVMQGIGSEIVLIDYKPQRAKAEADDILHAVPFAHSMKVYAGDYPDLVGTKVVIIAAGVGQKPGETRLDLLVRNSIVFQEVVGKILTHAPQAILLVATNPVDVMTQITTRFAIPYGVPHTHVIGSGTTLDTARFRALLGNHFGVASQHVHGYVIGEHGDSEVLTWSQATIAGMPLEEFAVLQNIPLDDSVREAIDLGVRRAAYSIIEGKGATYYGIGSALARIVRAIMYDQRAVLTVTSVMDSVVGVRQVAVSLPHLIGAQGVLATLPSALSDAETAALKRSAQVIRDAVNSLESLEKNP